MRKKEITKELSALGFSELEHKGEQLSALTTGWRVDWDEDFIARDLWQNFYDANRQNLGDVRVEVRDDQVEIFGPQEFDLDLSFFLESTKGSEDVGGFGEGFKAAVTCLIRDHRIHPVLRSGGQVVHISKKEEALPSGGHPLIYNFFTTGQKQPGTTLILQGCSPKLVAALRSGLNHFFCQENELIGDCIWKHWEGKFSLFRCTMEDGYVFYRGLRRGRIGGVPLVLVVNHPYAALEKVTSQDRDRKAFGAAILPKFYSIFCRYGVNDFYPPQHEIVLATRHLWSLGKGHPLLEQLARVAVGRWKETGREIFGDTFFATDRGGVWSGNSPNETQALVERWKAEGRTPLPAYFADFGVKSPQQTLSEERANIRKKAEESSIRRLTQAEEECLAVLTDTTEVLSPALSALIIERSIECRAILSSELHGELRESFGRKSELLLLNVNLFEGGWGEALSVYLHEAAHCFGFDGSRQFTDALTRLIASLVEKRRELDDREQQWSLAVKKVKVEQQDSLKLGNTLADKLERLSDAELRRRVSLLPSGALKELVCDKASEHRA